jgi:hypothetical protein
VFIRHSAAARRCKSSGPNGCPQPTARLRLLQTAWTCLRGLVIQAIASEPREQTGFGCPVVTSLADTRDNSCRYFDRNVLHVAI